MNRYGFTILIRMAQKELYHIARDWQTLGILLGLPVFMMFLFGYALNSDVEDSPIAVIDASGTHESRELIAALDQSSLLQVIGSWPAGTQPQQLFRSFRVRAVAMIPADFAECLANDEPQIQVQVDGSDPSTGAIILNALQPLVQTRIMKIAEHPQPLPIKSHKTVLYNPGERSSLFFVPGLMATILIIICALMTSITITREKETGTLDNLLVSPASPLFVLLGKLLPYFAIAAIDGVLIMAIGYLAFGVVLQGSVGLLVITTMLYLLVSLSIGLLVSTIAKQQQHAMMMVLGMTMMPTMMLSGFVFPISSMPYYLQVIAHLIPATWYLQAVRGIVLKGIGLPELWTHLVVLTAQFFVLLFVSVKKFKLQR